MTYAHLAHCALFALASLPAAQQSEALAARPPALDVESRSRGSLERLPSPASCMLSLRDLITGGCLEASSSATSGLLFPYPGMDNRFAAPVQNAMWTPSSA